MRTTVSTLLVLLVTACAANSDTEGPTPGSETAKATQDTTDETTEAAPDTVRGTIAIVGAEPLTQVVIRPTNAPGEITLHSETTEILRRLAGLEIQIEGHNNTEDKSFKVQDFQVRALDGTPAIDGIIANHDGKTILIRNDGQQITLSSVPKKLQERIGAHVWIAGTPEGRIEAYGIIEDI